jgi:hypothetical protein
MNLETRDLAVIVGGVLISLVGGYAAHSGVLAQGQVDSLTFVLPHLTMLVLFVGVLFVILSRDLLGGDTARNLEVIASGFLIYAVLYYPHKEMWHGAGFGGDKPAWLIFSSGAWQTFFHFFTVVTLVIVAYGFYLFWQMGQGDTV